MSRFYADASSKDVIRQGLELYANFDKVMKKNPNNKITDLFFIHTGKGLEFIHKKSAKGKWLAFTSAVKRLFKAKDDPLRIASNLESAAALINAATKADDKFFEQLAKEQAVAQGQHPTKQEIILQSKKMRANINQLGDHLQGIRSHIEIARLKKGRVTTDLARIPIHKTKAVAQTHFDDLIKFTDETKTLLLPLFKDSELPDDIKEELAEEITVLLSTHVDGAAIVDELKAAAKHDFPPASLDTLKLAMMKGVTYVSPARSEKLLTALQEIPSVPPQGQGVPFTDLMLVFGDKFIAESGLEGGDSTIPYCQLMADFIKDRNISTPRAKQMQELAANMIDLRNAAGNSGESLRKEIKQKLAAQKGELTKKCVFNAGWVGHGIVYEMEEQKDGKFTFRVFNRGEGADLHDQLKGKYGTTDIACIEIKDIPKKRLFKKNFLGALGQLSSMSKDGIKGVKPVEMLIYHLLPMLGGKKGEPDPRIQRFLNAHLSGTCPYASAQAWAATQMTSEEFVQFECDFKTYLLERNYPEMLRQGSQKITMGTEYDLQRRNYAAIKRSLEDFSTSLKQTQGRIPNAKIEAAQAWILRTQVELVKIDKQLLDYEKEIYTKQLTDGGLVAGAIRLNLPEGQFVDQNLVGVTATVVGVPKQNMALLQKISELPQDITSKEFSEKLGACLDALAIISNADNCLRAQFFDLTDSLLKRIGPLQNWKRIQFSEPDKSMDDLQTIARYLGGPLTWNAGPHFKTESYLRYLDIVFGMETAFNQCKREERVLSNDLYRSMISENSVQKQLSQLRCADPYWVSMREQMIEFARHDLDFANPFSALPLNNKEGMIEFGLSNELAKDIIKWWEGNSNTEIREKVDESIKKDRKEQESEIKRQIQIQKDAIELLKGKIEDENKKIAAARQEINRLPTALLRNEEQVRMYEAHRMYITRAEDAIRELNRGIGQHNLNIQGIPDQVKNDSKYWPQGFEDNISNSKKATFLMHSNIAGRNFFEEKGLYKPIMPDRFRAYAIMAMNTGNIFSKTSVAPFKNYPFFDYKVDEKNAITNLGALNLNQDPTVFSPEIAPYKDPYIEPIKASTNEEFTKVYEQVYATNMPESTIPSKTTTNPIEGIEDETFRNLLSLRSDSNVQIESVLSYFQEHSDELSNSGKLNLFHSLLFDSALLLNELKDEKRAAVLIPWMQDFFAGAIKNAQELNEYHTAANMLWMAANIQKYINFVSADRVKEGKQPLGSIIKASQYIELMEKGTDAKYAAQWSVLGEAFLAACGDMLHLELKTEEMEKLFAYGIMAHMLTAKYAIDQNQVCVPRKEQASLAVRALKKRFTESMITGPQKENSPSYLDPEKLTAIVNKFDLPMLKAMYPFLKTDKFTYDSIKYVLASNDGSLLSLMDGMLIPSDPTLLRVYSNPVAKELVEELIRRGVYADENLAHLRCYTEDGVTYIHDAKKGLELKVNQTSPHASIVYVKTLGDKNWGMLISHKEIKNVYMSNIELKEKYLHVLTKDGLLLCDMKTFEPIYKTNGSHLTKPSIKDGKETLKLCSAVSSPFTSFESDNCTTMWSDRDNVMQEINFSRLGITLQREKTQDKDTWHWAENKEWTLSKEQFLPHFGGNTGFLLFENAKGKKRALIPVWEPKKEDKKALNFPYVYNHEENTVREGRYVECEVEDNRVVPNSLEARFYLAKIYLEKGEIDWAEELLFAHVAELTHTAFSKEEKKMLTDVINKQVSGDIGARNLRLRMRALYLLERNLAQFPDPTFKAKWDVDGVTISLELYGNYLQRLMDLRPLDSREELFLLNNNERYSLNPLLQKRKSELEGTAIPDYVSVSETPMSWPMLTLQSYIGAREETVRKGLYWTPAGLVADKINRFLDELGPLSTLATFPILLPYGIWALATNVLKKTTQFVSLIDRYKPTLMEKARYRHARLANTFPFNPQTVTAEEFKHYYRLLKAESKASRSWNAGTKSGLIQALYQMALFNNDLQVQERAAGLLKDMRDVAKKPQMPYRGKTAVQVPKTEKDDPIIHDLQGLVPLKAISSATELVHISKEKQATLAELGASFLEKEETPPRTVSSENLFSANYPEVTDKTVANEFKLMKEDVEAADLKEFNYKVITGERLEELEEILEDDLNKGAQVLALQEHRIINSVTSALCSDSASFMKYASKERQMPAIEELCILAAHPNFDKMMTQLYPEISTDGKAQLKKAVTDYLVQKQFVQHLRRAKQQVGDVLKAGQADEETQQILRNVLGKSLESIRGYDVNSNPHALVYLLIETTLNIKLRKEQVDNIEKLAKGLGMSEEIVLQMIMGAGKTFAVQPSIAYFLTLLRPANTKILSTVIVPEALLAPVKDGLVRTLGNAYHQFVYFLNYDRQLAKSESYLQSFYDSIVEAEERGGCVLFTPRQKHSIVTSLYESYHDMESDPTDLAVQKRNKLISKIVDKLGLDEHDQIDEIDLVMNPQIIFKYPIGSKEIVDHTRVGILSDMLLDLAYDKSFTADVSIDFMNALQGRVDPNFKKSGAGISKELFKTVVQPKLVQTALKFLTDKRYACQELAIAARNDTQQYLQNFLTQTTPFEDDIRTKCLAAEEVQLAKWLPTAKEKLEEVIQNGSQGILESIDKAKQKLITKREDLQSQEGKEEEIKTLAAEIKALETIQNAEPALWKLIASKKLYKINRDKWIKENVKDARERELLGTCAHAIADLLPTSLFRECGTHYGEDPKPGNYVARPYEAPRAPKETMYGDAYEQALFSIQKTAYHGIPIDAAKKMLSQLQKHAKLEMKQSACKLDQTPAYKRYEEIIGADIAKFHFLQEPLSDAFISAFQKASNVNRQCLQEFVEEYIVPQIAVYTQELSSTPQTMKGSSKMSAGYTGTLHPGILARTMTAVPDKGTDGKTTTAIQEQMEKGLSQVEVFPEKTDHSFAKQMIDTFIKDPMLLMFIDSGGWLKDEDVDAYAEAFLTACENSDNRKNIKGIVYHNAKGEIITVERDVHGKFIRKPLSESKLLPNERITVIQKRYETGTNIFQDPMAKVFMSMAKEMLGDRVRQAIFRARQILQGQTLSIALTPEVSDHIAVAIVDGLLMKEDFRKLFNKETAPKELTREMIKEMIKALNLPSEAIHYKKMLEESLKEFNKQGLFEKIRSGEMKSQEAAYAFSKCFVNDFEPTSSEIWRYVTVNQARAKQDKNWQAGIQKMREVIEKPIRQALSNPALSLADRQALYKASKDLLVRTTKDSPFDKLMAENTTVDADTAIASEVSRHMALFQKSLLVPQNVRDVILKNASILYAEEGPQQLTAEKLVEKALNSCINKDEIPEVIDLPLSTQGQELEVEIEQEQEQEKEMEQEKEVQVQVMGKGLDAKAYEILVERDASGYRIEKFFTQSRGIFEYKGVNLAERMPGRNLLPDLDKIQATRNWMIKARADIGSADYGNYLLPARYMLALSGPKTTDRRYIIVNDNDAGLLKNGLYSSRLPQGCHAALFMMDGKLVAGDAASKQVLETEEFARVRLQAKLLAGKVNFTKAETDQLEQMIRQGAQNNEEIARRATELEKIHTNVIKYMHETARHYPGSYLQKMFKKLKLVAG